MTRRLMRAPIRTGLSFMAASLCAWLGVSGAHAQKAQAAPPNQSVRDGVYTDAQAERGKGQYGQHCAVCHGPTLEGNAESPPLVGEFIPDWTGTTLDELYDKIETTMPLNAPGTLRPAIAAEILAYLLQANDFPAGPKDLDTAPDSLKRITFDVPRSKPPSAP